MASKISQGSPETSEASEKPPARGLSLLAAVLVTLLILLTVGAIVIALVMANNVSIEKDTLWYEIGKLVAQAGILTGFGAMLTLLVHEFQQDQEDSRKRIAAQSQELADRHAWLRDFATRLTDAYGDVKQSRRRLQWALETTGDEKYVSTKVYEKQLKKLSVIQTEFEFLHTFAETYLREGDPAEAVKKNLQSIIDRLSGLISERKKFPPRHPEEEVRLSLAKREVLRCFTAESKERDFNGPLGFAGVRKCYKEIVKGIIDELHRAQASMSTPGRSWRRTG